MWSRLLLYVGAGMVLLVSAVLVANGLTSGLVALGAVAVLVVIVCAGPERAGFLFLGLAFLTAPFYKGLVQSGTTPTDAFLVAGVGLLFPRMLLGRSKVAPPYLFAAIVIGVTGVAAAMTSPYSTYSLITLAQWLICIIGIPLILISLNLSLSGIDRLAWTFVGGQLISTVAALVRGPVDGGRYLGLTQHPNAFAQSALLAFGLLLYLLPRTRFPWLAYAGIAMCLGDIYISGSRGGTVAVAVVILLIPVVERSAVATYLLAFAGVAAALVLEKLISAGQAGGSLARLTGSGSAAGSDAIRSQTLKDGWHRFLQHPVLGNGFFDLFWIHNNYLEVAVAVGVIGVAGYVMLLWTLGRGLIGRSEVRRICYPVVAYAVFGATVPSLTDRSIWLAVALSVAVYQGFPEPPRLDPKAEAPDEEPAASTSVERRPRPVYLG